MNYVEKHSVAQPSRASPAAYRPAFAEGAAGTLIRASFSFGQGCENKAAGAAWKACGRSCAVRDWQKRSSPEKAHALRADAASRSGDPDRREGHIAALLADTWLMPSPRGRMITPPFPGRTPEQRACAASASTRSPQPRQLPPHASFGLAVAGTTSILLRQPIGLPYLHQPGVRRFIRSFQEARRLFPRAYPPGQSMAVPCMGNLAKNRKKISENCKNPLYKSRSLSYNIGHRSKNVFEYQILHQKRFC